MHTTSISCLKFRRGTSTILGTLIFVGIMFTAVIPMLLVMNQADTLYEIRKFEVERIDEEHSREDIGFYAYILPDFPDDICVKIENKGDAPVKIVRVWINDVEYPQEVDIQSMKTSDLESFPVDPQSETSYTVKVITEKGNVFSSEAGTLYYSGGGWYSPSTGICVHILNFMGKYRIIIKPGTDPLTEPLYEYESHHTEHGEIIRTFMVDPGFYLLTIQKDAPSGWVEVVPQYNDDEIEVIWPSEWPITDVYTSDPDL